VSKDGKKAFFVSGGDLYTMTLSGAKREGHVHGGWERNIRAERQAAFTHSGASYERGFYDANFTGATGNRFASATSRCSTRWETSDEFAACSTR